MPLESYFESKHDGLKISFAHQHADDAKAVLVIAHGMAEHKKRYYPFMEYLAENGIASVIEDHRGHGESVRSAKDLGYFGENGADGLISDLKQLTDYVKQKYPDKPTFMLGHSMGALAVRTFIQKHGDMLDGLLVSGNPGNNSAASMAVKMARHAQRKNGSHARSKVLTMATLLPFRLASGNVRSKNGWICLNKETVAKYDADPLCGFEFYANGYEALLTLMVKANDPNAPAPNKKLPVRFFSGDKDPCMGSKKALESAAGLLAKAGYTDVTIKIYPNMSHEILNETERQKIYQDMLAFITG